MLKGEVIVGIDKSKKSLTLKELVDDAEHIIEVDGDSVEVTDNSNYISVEVIKRNDLTAKK